MSARSKASGVPPEGVQIPLYSAPRKTTPRVPLRELVLKAIADFGPITDEQLIRKLRKNANSVRPRRVELANSGAIVEAGTQKRPGRRDSTLWDVPRNVDKAEAAQ